MLIEKENLKQENEMESLEGKCKSWRQIRTGQKIRWEKILA